MRKRFKPLILIVLQSYRLTVLNTVLQSSRLTVLLIVLQSYSLTVLSQDLQFYREDIVFKISAENIVTDATYNFCNLSGKNIKTPLFYPFPENTRELIDSIVIKDVKPDTVLSFREGRSGVLFPISVKAYGQAAYRVYFRQKLTEKKFTYILTSTETWGRALEFANFELQAPIELSIDSLSYPPDTFYIQNDVQYYFWKKKDFMPERDFVVFF
jgi:hypothetical protein